MFELPIVKTTLKKLLRTKTAGSHGLKAKFFDQWYPELDDVLKYLPESNLFPHELFRMLMIMADPQNRRIILVTERGDPVALAGLRNRWGFWEPITQWIVPGVLFPIREGYLARVLPALGIEMKIAWWRFPEPPPQMQWMKNLSTTPTYGMHLEDDYEKYWRKMRNFDKDIVRYRMRCQYFNLEVNLACSAEWTLRHWSEKWQPHGSTQMPDIDERLLVAQFLEKRGLHYTLSLCDQAKIVAGLTFLIHGNDAIAQVSYRNPAYNRHGVMTRLWDLAFQWASREKFRKIDLGGDHEYKLNWAPIDGEKYLFTIYPSQIWIRKKVSDLVAKARKSLKKPY
jgi:hypothetical protein